MLNTTEEAKRDSNRCSSHKVQGKAKDRLTWCGDEEVQLNRDITVFHLDSLENCVSIPEWRKKTKQVGIEL